jgi:hypothetical protein
MLKDRDRLVEEISRLERELDAQHFRSLVDHKAQHQKEKRLKKLRRELAELDGTVVHQEPFRKPEPEPAPPTRKPAAPPKGARETATAAPAPQARKPAARTKAPTRSTSTGKAKPGGAKRAATRKPAGPATKSRKSK